MIPKRSRIFQWPPISVSSTMYILVYYKYFQCDWIVHVEGGGNWKPGAIVQFQHKKKDFYIFIFFNLF